MRWFVFSVVALVGCKNKEPIQAEFADLVTPMGAGKQAPICKKENDGRQATVTGYLLLSDNVRISDGRVDIEFYKSVEDGEGKGRPAVVSLAEDKQISFVVTDKKTGGYNTTKGTIKDVTIHAASGDKKPGDRVDVTFAVKVIEHFQTHEITACELEVVAIK